MFKNKSSALLTAMFIVIAYVLLAIKFDFGGYLLFVTFLTYYIICLIKKVSFFGMRNGYMGVQIQAKRTIFYNSFFILMVLAIFFGNKQQISPQPFLITVLPGILSGYILFQAMKNAITKISN